MGSVLTHAPAPTQTVHRVSIAIPRWGEPRSATYTLFPGTKHLPTSGPPPLPIVFTDEVTHLSPFPIIYVLTTPSKKWNSERAVNSKNYQGPDESTATFDYYCHLSNQ